MKYLAGVARTDVKVNGDLAAAYYVRAQRNDTPDDLLLAHDALALSDPESSMTRFNRALIMEALGLTEEAIAAWSDFVEREPASPWSPEAIRKRAHLESVRFRSDWRATLQEALDRRDRPAVRRLIAPVLDTAESYLEDILLPQWASDGKPETLAQAALLAEEISRRIGDTYPMAVVEASRLNPSADMRKGLQLFSQRTHEKGAEKLKKANILLEQSGSPLHLLAGLYLLTGGASDGEKLEDDLQKLEESARARGHKHVATRVRSVHAFVAAGTSRYVDALATYDEAQRFYAQIGDRENIATIHARRAGIFNVLGQHQRAWREALLARKHQGSVGKTRNARLLAGETATTALALGYPAVALLYHQADVRRARQAVDNTTGEERETEKGYLAIALRGLADKQVEAGQYEFAQANLKEASELLESSKTADEIRKAIQSRLVAVEGEVLLRTNPDQAVHRFTEALRLAGEHEIATVRVSFLIRRAEANFLAKRPRASEDDLRNALSVLRYEEADILARRKPGENEEIWSPYFRRFERTYHRLIADLLDRGAMAEAFKYAETARAFEPINLIKLHDGDGFVDVANLADAQRRIPVGTVVLDYVVMDDRTYVWIISRDDARVVRQSARRDEIQGWREELQSAIARQSESDARGLLSVLYDQLLKEPLKQTGSAQRLVIVPGAEMEVLPFAAFLEPVKQRYLVQEQPVVSTAGSLSLYLWALDRDQKLSEPDESPSVLLIGNPAANEQLAQQYGRLGGAEAEVKDLELLYGPAAMLLTGRMATANAFMELAPKHAIVHVAAHAIVHPGAPWKSLILLAPSEDKSHSGALQAVELLIGSKQLSKTRLVVLAACQSAAGAPIGPEGMAPLVRPLIAQGVPAIIGSLWDVNDATTKPLMVSFHRHYQAGNEVAVALQLAQRELLDNNNDPDSQSVLAWGAFQVIGYADSPFRPAAR
ncbi:MAG TPA: CHAT domain-containing protein [Thermoanaerobaculia bacterium]